MFRGCFRFFFNRDVAGKTAILVDDMADTMGAKRHPFAINAPFSYVFGGEFLDEKR